jgi:hypothetical protein
MKGRSSPQLTTVQLDFVPTVTSGPRWSSLSIGVQSRKSVKGYRRQLGNKFGLPLIYGVTRKRDTEPETITYKKELTVCVFSLPALPGSSVQPLLWN